ncbi:MAG: DUF1844 domain-containing protein [Acidobacteria bacterium]|nr:DUF1844 domain-containing protein [Acidobacteriota bacterium]
MAEEDSGFRVADRRKFTEDGELRDLAKEAPSGPASPAGASGAARGQESAGENASPPVVGQDSRESKMDFPTLVLSLTTTAMLQMGLVPDPVSQRVEKNLPAARQTIDILEILKDKTQGNLQPDETRLLDRCLHDLKMSFVESTRRVTL